MQKCPHCSAPLSDEIERCTFCGTLTPTGVRAKQARDAREEAERRSSAQRSVEEAAAARARAQPEVETAGKWALLSSILGTVLCCLVPVGPVMGIVFGLRARRLAQQHGLPGATLGTAGLAIGIGGVVLAVAGWVGAAVMTVQDNRHRDELKGQLAQVNNPTLDLKTACALTELELLDSRYEEFTSLETFECQATGDVDQDGDTALLRGGRFVKGSEKIDVFSCLRFGNKWTVQQVRDDEECAAPKPEKRPRRKKRGAQD